MKIFREKYRAERSEELAAACNITAGSVNAVFYDLALRRRYAKAVRAGGNVAAGNALEELAELFGDSLDAFGISAHSIKRIGIAAPFPVESALGQMLSVESLGLFAETEIFFIPFVSAGISGAFTASLLTLPEGDCVAADFGKTFCAARIEGGTVECAAFGLQGAFDGSGLENGIPAERGAIDAVRREKDGTIAYEVVDDCESVGVSPCAAAMAAVIMRRTGVLDSDGIMTDRDLFHIGEDFFVSQSDIRAIQSDKAMTAAVLEIFSGKERKSFFSGEVFSGAGGFRALLELGVVPSTFSKAAFCRNSTEQGIILCLESDEMRQRAWEISRNARDITEELLPRVDTLYLENLEFK